MKLIKKSNRVAVIPVDPSSHISGGSILGDSFALPVNHSQIFFLVDSDESWILQSTLSNECISHSLDSRSTLSWLQLLVFLCPSWNPSRSVIFQRHQYRNILLCPQIYFVILLLIYKESFPLHYRYHSFIPLEVLLIILNLLALTLQATRPAWTNSAGVTSVTYVPVPRGECWEALPNIQLTSSHCVRQVMDLGNIQLNWIE